MHGLEYVHIEHCYPGANRCYKHGTPLFWRTETSSDKSDHWGKHLVYTRNNQEYMAFCMELQKKGAFADRSKLIAGLDAIVRMLSADELYINQAAVNMEYTDPNLWDTRTNYRGYVNEKHPTFSRVKSIPEILSVLMTLFGTAKNVVQYYSSAAFETPENKVILFLRLLTGDAYKLVNIEKANGENTIFTAIHTCGSISTFSLNDFSAGKRCDCENMTDCVFLAYANEKMKGYFEFKESISHPHRFEIVNKGIDFSRFPFSYTTRDSYTDGALPKEYILQEINRPSLSTVLKIGYEERLYRETFRYIREKEEVVEKKIKRLKAGEVFDINNILQWADFKRNRDIYILNGVNKIVNELMETAFHDELFVEQTDSRHSYVRT